MNGAGNDFVVLDNRDNSLELTREEIALLCNRQRGVGSDGLLAVEPAEKDGDFRMRYYNADGGEAEMCGNGARCFAKFVNFLHDDSLEKVSFETIAGMINADFHGENVCINLSEPFDLKLEIPVMTEHSLLTVHSVNTGVPHAVIEVNDLGKADVTGIGSSIRYHEAFRPSGTNVNLMEVLAPSKIAIRTYERGVEDETLACGTGMVAAAIIHHELTGASTPIEVTVKGGDTLEVNFEKQPDGTYQEVTLLGPADFTFAGETE